MEADTNKHMTFAQHVAELKKRLGIIAVTLIAFGGLGYYFREPLIVALQKPLKLPLYYSSPAGSFNFVMQIGLLIGLYFSIPTIIYHLIRFIEPALQGVIKKAAIFRLIVMSFTLANAGILFAYFFIIPLSLKFFNGYSSDVLKPLISADQYMSFILSVLITFIVIFQIPLIVLFINRITPLKPSSLLKHQKLIVVGALALAVVLPFTYSPLEQFILAAPIIGLYYMSVVMVYFTNKFRRVSYFAVVGQPAFVPLEPELERDFSPRAISITQIETIPGVPGPRKQPILVDGMVVTKAYKPRVTLAMPRQIELPKVPRRISVA